MLQAEYARMFDARELCGALLERFDDEVPVALRVGFELLLVEHEHGCLLLGGFLEAGVELPEEARSGAADVSVDLVVACDRVAGQHGLGDVLGHVNGVDDCVGQLGLEYVQVLFGHVAGLLQVVLHRLSFERGQQV